MSEEAKTEFEIGATVWDRSGIKYGVEAKTEDGRYVVNPFVSYYDSHDREFEDASDALHFKRPEEIFPKPPKMIVDAEIAKQHREMSDLREKAGKIYGEAVQQEREAKARMDKLKVYKGLERLEDFIAGRITHLLIKDYSGYDVKTFADAAAYWEGEHTYRRQTGIKLITLFGKSNGDLEWGLSEYTDGSGSYRCTVFPCMSEEEAVELRNKMVLEDIDKVFAMDHKPSDFNKGWWDRLIYAAVSQAEKYGLDIPAGPKAAADAEQARMDAQQRTNMEKQIADAKANLAKLEERIRDAK